VVLVFEDGSTFELQPVEKDSLETNFKYWSKFELQPVEKLSLKMSINQIPSEITDGTNHSNFDANIVFSDLLGNYINELTVQTFHIESEYNNFTHKEVQRFRRYIFLTSGEFGFSITHQLGRRLGGWYHLELRNQNHFTCDGIELVTKPYKKVKESFKPVRQIVIVEGHDYSSYYWIQPVKQLSSQDEGDYGFEEFEEGKISIEQDDVFQFLRHFLLKYFDEKFEYIDRASYYEGVFADYLEHNIYTYDTVRAMIAEIRTVADMLINDFDNPDLAEVKSYFSPYTFYEKKNRRAVDITPEEKNEIFRANIDIAIDFYERFCRRMESMMAHAPQYNQISFMGP
ncbi:MAG: hypothetical protein FWH52_07420, partial [Synergistaceae bacterium]|nr:hypothetical protein [Synergistaceae bacterium]